MPLVRRRSTNDHRKTYVIAEMAWSHNGSLHTALQILRGAKAAGADSIGIHLTSLDDYMVRDYRSLDGQTLSARQETQKGEIYSYLEQINLEENEWVTFFRESQRIGMDLCIMCNDHASLRFAQSQSCPAAYALPAACFTECDFVTEVANQKKPVVLRIGGATLGEIEDTINRIRGCGNADITLLHGIQLYPTDVALLNLSAIPVLKAAFGCPVGLADHIDASLEEARSFPLLAIPLGASVIEKHITVNREFKHEDYEAALGANDFRKFIESVERAELSLGDGSIATLTSADIKYRRVSRKRIVARRPLAKGSVIAKADIVFKRSDSGLDPSLTSLLIGRTLRSDVEKDEGLDFSKIV